MLLVGLLTLARCSGAEEDAATTGATTATTEAEVGSEGSTRMPTGETNLIADGDFEESTRGWALGAYGGSAGRVARSTAESKFGEAALALAVSTPGDIAAALRAQPVRPSTTHTISAWVKSPAGTSNALRVIGAGGDRLVSPEVPGNGTWKPLRGRFTTAPGEMSIEIRVIQGGEPATSYIDGVQLDFEHRHAGWSHETVIRRIDDARIGVNGRPVALDNATLTCGGEGRGFVRNGERLWTHFRCIQPTFPEGGLVGPDAVFRVHVTGRDTFAITDARLVRY